MEGRPLIQLGWGVVGTGAIAGDFLHALSVSERCRVVNVVGSSPSKARGFADLWRVPRASATLDELLGDPAVEAIYVATPHPQHEAAAFAAITARKHVLCEKPMATEAAGAARILTAARGAGVFVMEAFMYRCHPLLAQLARQVGEGAIGPVRHVRASFGFRARRDPASRLFDPALGGGGILDVGGYPASFARLIAGIAVGKPYAEPVTLEASGFVGPTGVDELATAQLSFSSGVTATLECAVRHELGTAVTVFGETGHIEAPNPWTPGGQRHGLESSFSIHRDGRAPELVTVRTPRSIYALQAELVADTLPALEAPWPAMGWEDTLGNMRLLDQWRAALSAD